jgi:hypothetical protein
MENTIKQILPSSRYSRSVLPLFKFYHVRFVVYVTKFFNCQMVGVLVDHELELTWKEAAVSYFKILYVHLRGGTGKSLQASMTIDGLQVEGSTLRGMCYDAVCFRAENLPSAQ